MRLGTLIDKKNRDAGRRLDAFGSLQELRKMATMPRIVGQSVTEVDFDGLASVGLLEGANQLMAVGKQGSGPLWAVGQFTLRVRGPGATPGRVVRVRKPFALIGRHPDADVWIDDPSVEDRHAVLILDRRGLFGVDLLSRSGTRFAGADSGSSWLSLGDLFEVAGRRVELVQLKVDGRAIDPPLSNDDPLEGIDNGSLVSLTLEPVAATGPPWMIGSSLAFLGRGEACAVKVDDASVKRTHCALLRGSTSAYVIDLLGNQTLINDIPIDGASPLMDGDILTMGESRFLVRVDGDPSFPSISKNLMISQPRSTEIVPGSQEMLRTWLVEAIAEGMGSPHDHILNILKQFQSDTATILKTQFDRIEALNHEIALLRDELRRGTTPPHFPEPAQPLQMDLLPRSQADAPGRSSTWLLERLNGLEQESRTTCSDLLGKITSSIKPRNLPPEPGSDLVPAPSNPWKISLS